MIPKQMLPSAFSSQEYEKVASDEKEIATHSSAGPPIATINGLASEKVNGSLHNQSGPRRALSGRSFSGSRGGASIDASIDDLEEGIVEKSLREKYFSKWRNQALISGLAYCLSSCSMILLNKIVLSSYNLEAGLSLMVYQNCICVLIVFTLCLFGIIYIEPLTWKLVRVWFPVNIIFVGMLISSIYSLKHMSVAMVTILKNVTNLITAIGELLLFKKHHNRKVWASLILMVVSAICGGITDLSFHRIGYTWQILNCFLTAAYSLTLRKVMDLAKQATKSGSISEFTMVLLSNALSLPLGLVLVLLFKETEYLCNSPVIRLPSFWMVSTLSGVLGFAISFTSLWFLHQTSATTYSLVGSLNKIPLSIAGILLFKVPTSIPNLLSICFGLFAGILFARAKIL